MAREDQQYLEVIRKDFRSEISTTVLDNAELIAAVEKAVLDKVCSELCSATYEVQRSIKKDYNYKPLPQSRDAMRRWMERMHELLDATERMELQARRESKSTNEDDTDGGF
jgi:hypothetical protein